MLIKSLQLSFDRREGEVLIFKTETGAEVSITDYLLENYKEKDKKIYLCAGYQPHSQVDDSHKTVLNELLDGNKD
ncbi:hypothetical protein HOB10_05565 [Candidatus Parcubacteria bacterium]|jgi:hypothetical protein|nr:hypothetical protein [Candidatus Parcubacteria bacterium]